MKLAAVVLLLVAGSAYALRGEFAFVQRSRASAAIRAHFATSLKDSESARFKFNFADLTSRGGHVCGVYNAKNSFDAYVGDEPFDVYLSNTEDGFLVLDGKYMEQVRANRKPTGNRQLDSIRAAHDECNPLDSQ